MSYRPPVILKPSTHRFHTVFLPRNSGLRWTHSNLCRPSAYPSSLLRPAISVFYRSFAVAITKPSPDQSLTRSDAQRSTIFALSTPPGKGGVAVMRISGPQVLDVLRLLTRTGYAERDRGIKIIKPWRFKRCKIVNPETEEILDEGLVVYFEAPKSFTTEDVLELHVHSGRAVISSILDALSRLSFCRPAEPGEFTRRAFLGGRLDLTQVEGLKDLIDADTDAQRKIALRAAAGEVRSSTENLRFEIIKCLSMVEALIDFSEGEDIEEGVYEQARERAHILKQTIEGYLSDSRTAEIVRSGIRLAIFGPPNAGKSSLLNYLVQREAAIVTPIPGTTRDAMELSLDVDGLPVIAIDTAGLRKTEDVIENIGIERARKVIQEADGSLCVLPLPDVLHAANQEPHIHIPSDLTPLIKPDTLFLLNKTDLLHMERETINTAINSFSANAWAASLTSKEGLDSFLRGLSKTLHDRYDPYRTGDDAHQFLITHARHRMHLQSAVGYLGAFLNSSAEDIVLGAEELRYAARAIGKISGFVDIEEVLDAIFREFCIGK